MITKYANFILKNRFAVLVFMLLLATVATYGAKNLVFSSDYRIFFSEDNPQLIAFDKMQDTYNKNDNVMIMLRPKSGNVFNAQTFEAILKLTTDSWQTPYSSRVDSLANFQHTYSDEDDLIVGDLIDAEETINKNYIQKIKKIALAEPLLINRIISPAGHATGVNITVQLPGAHNNEIAEIATFVREMLKKYRAEYPDIEFTDTGGVMMNNAFPEASKSDMQTLVPITFLIIMLGLYWFTKSLSGTLGTFLIIVLSIITAMGTAGWLGIKLSPPSASAPLLILTLAVADCVHFLMSMLQHMQQGKNKNEAIVESIRINFHPIFLTSLTTAIGFFSMNFSDAPPFRDLGNITAIGVIYAFFLSLTILPILMSFLPVKVKHGKVQQAKYKIIDNLATNVIKYQKRYFIAMTIVIVGLISLVPLNQLNDKMVEYFDTSMEFRQKADLLTDNLTGLYFIDFSLGSREAGGISSPKFLHTVEKFSKYLKNKKDTLHVYSFTDVEKRLNKNMHSDDEAWYKIPEKRDLAAQYLLLYEMSLPYGLDLNNQMNVDKSSLKLTATLNSISSQDMIKYSDDAIAWFDKNAPEIDIDPASSALMFSHIGMRNIKSMLSGVAVALIMISALLIFALGSFKHGMISLIPNIAPAMMAFGVWGVLVGQIGLAASVVTSMSLGIVVDDSIHFLSKYLRARREKNMPAPEAVRYAFNTVGAALLVTTVILVGGFSVLSQSGFSINSDTGLLTAITIVLALIADFLFLPPLLMWMDRKKA
ncbi:MAG: RND family transporter [Gammaproteobacteria bacterium]|nr:MAG: RND family transporter [Gammaproteobacteria bacterium]